MTRAAHNHHVLGNGRMALVVALALLSSEAWAYAAPAASAAPSQVEKIEGTALYGRLPQMPPVRACTQKDLVGGLWRMVALYEQPPTSETRAVRSHPRQYMHFGSNNMYRDRRFAPNAPKDRNFYRNFFYREGDPVHQFVLHETGYIYFYNEGVVTDTRQCLIVTLAQGIFKPDQMLLVTPPRPVGQIAESRSVRQYQHFGGRMIEIDPVNKIFIKAT